MSEHTPGDGSFPPAMMCTCGCVGSAHVTRWTASSHFGGTRCAAHGGHKFTPVLHPKEAP